MHYLSYGEEFNRKTLSDRPFHCQGQHLLHHTPARSRNLQILKEFQVSRRGTKSTNCVISGSPRTIG